MKDWRHGGDIWEVSRALNCQSLIKKQLLIF